MPKWIDNDTMALAFIGVVAIIGVLFKNENITLSALGALSGFLGAIALADKGNNKPE